MRAQTFRPSFAWRCFVFNKMYTVLPRLVELDLERPLVLVTTLLTLPLQYSKLAKQGFQIFGFHLFTKAGNIDLCI